MNQSPPINIVQAKDETLIFSEQHSTPRHIYTDGRQHPPAATSELTTDGHSIGHWEGDTLVVDTTNFISDMGMTGIAGGGLRTSTSHLVEHFKLINNGENLQITSTWSDPNVYAEPFSYTYTYFRDGPDEFSLDEYCDAGDSSQGKSAETPKQY